MDAKQLKIVISVSAENVQAVIDTYKEQTEGKLPTEKWMRTFLRAWVENETMDVGGTFVDDLYNAVSESLPEEEEARRAEDGLQSGLM